MIIPYEHLHPKVQKAIAENLSEIRIGKSNKTAGVAVVALGAAGIIGGALNESVGPMALGVSALPLGAELTYEGRKREKEARGPLNEKLMLAMNTHGPVAREFVEKYGLYYNPQVTWKKLAENYRAVIIKQKGNSLNNINIHIVKKLPILPISEISRMAMRKKAGVTA